jgi:hypothetical protein
MPEHARAHDREPWNRARRAILVEVMMRRRHSFLVQAIIAVLPPLVLAACSAAQSSDPSRETTDELSQVPQHAHRSLCPENVAAGTMRCYGRVRTDANGAALAAATPQGLTPADLKSAYALPSSGGNGRIIGIVDAQDDPKAESDLAVYRAQFGLPPCTTANGCFKKVNQNGVQGSYPTPDSGWAGEIALDLDMASAVCPDCKILLVEANAASTDDLGTAVNTAVTLGAVVVSNSYGGPEDSTVSQVSAQYFKHPGVLITASSGDSGYGVSFPASSEYVLAVGGTSLVKSTSTARGWKEGTWSGAGSGCSKYITKPSWQTDTGCSKRTVADVSAVADPNTGPAVYTTYGGSGWLVVGGTSASSPIVAGIYALTNRGAAGDAFAYQNTSDFYDVTTGSNGSCGGSYLCTAKAGYDGPTGLGAPNATAMTGAPSDGGTPPPPDAGPPPPDAGTDSGTGAACAHGTCSSGTKLVSSCDPCVTKICAADSFCCTTQWDSQCVGEVASICGGSCSGGGGGATCAHSKCSSGAKLTASCDACVSQICAADSYCCSTQWDSQCVGEVRSICAQSCP